MVAGHIRILIVSILAFFTGLPVMATHLMGGEITWRCQGNGTYIFRMKVYRDCLTPVPVVPPGGTIGLTVHNHPSVSYIPLYQVSFTDISPQCNGAGPSYNCANPQGNTAIEEYVFESNPFTLSGTPPPQGWVFTYSSCCRNAAISNLFLNFNGPGNPTNGFTLRAIMYPYNGQNTNPCFDSSPSFQERPAIVICAGSPFVYNPNAFDNDLDSLIYSFAQPLDYLPGGAFTSTNPPAIPFETGYSLNSPFPSTAQNPTNQGVVLNPQTGEMSFTSYTLGAFVVVVKASSYRCGQLIAEIFREIQVVILSCPSNQPPLVTPPFQNPLTGLFTDYTDTVTAGDLVTFNISAADGGFLPSGWAQSVVYTAQGGQFGSNFTDPNSGCPYPPCATLNPPPPVTNQGQVGTTFTWQTGCEHIAYPEGCYVVANTHTFTFLFKDDACPAPGYNVVTATVVVEALDVIGPPELRCVNVLANGSTQLSWLIPPDPEGTFNSYLIYSGPTANGPFTIIDSIFTYNQTTYTHNLAGANNAPVYYFLKSRSGCFGKVKSESSDTLASIHASLSGLTGTQYDLNWTPLADPLLPTSGPLYTVFKGPAPFSNVNQQAGFSYSDNISNCLDSGVFRIEIPDASGCVSGSNIVRRTFNFNTTPPDAQLDSISLQSGGPGVSVGWSNTLPNNGLYQYIIYEYINGSYLPIDTVPVNQGLITLNNPGCLSGQVSYALGVIDSCGNVALPNNPHLSIFLETEVSSCTNEARLKWKPYLGFQAGVLGYEVWVSNNGAPFALAGTASSNDTSLTYDQLTSGDNYCFFVRALGINGASSSSNYVCFAANTIVLADYTYLNFATVADNFTNSVRVYYDNTADMVSWYLTRLNMITGKTDSIGPMPLDLLNPFLDYLDEKVSNQKFHYRYQAILKDNCENFSDPSNIGQTIFLEARKVPGFYNRIKWTPYIDWPEGVEKYRVYHCNEKYDSLEVLVAEIPGDQLEFEEDVIDSLPSNGKICYRVEAVEADGNPYGFKESSKSNIVCLEHTPTLFIPSAWNRQGGLSTEFKPRGKYKELAVSYRFSIYNRWGEKIFETLDPEKAWDGTYMGAPVKSDVYVYDVFMTSGAGDDYQRVGTVTIVD